MMPHRFLEAARRLANGAGPEDWRSATSRAYYAVFNVAVRLLGQMNIHKPKANYHVVLQQRLLASGDPDLQHLGSDLGDFHVERNDADYKMDSKRAENQANAQAAVLKAEGMIAVLDGVPVGGIRANQIYAAIAKAKLLNL
jgi:uncharacterized protein (UPF0332 family)